MFLNCPERTALAIKDTDSSLKGKIMVVTEPRANYDALVAFGIFSHTKTTTSGDTIKFDIFKP
jgi:hypothetical protein